MDLHVKNFDVSHDVLDISDLLEGYSARDDRCSQAVSVGGNHNGWLDHDRSPQLDSWLSPVVQTIVLDGMSYSDLTGSGSSTSSGC